MRDLADRILAQARYDRAPEPLPERILGWFADRIGQVLSQLVGSGAGAVLAWAVVLGAVAAIAFLVVRHGQIGRPGRVTRGAPDVMIELTRTPAAWRAEAEAHEAAGRWREGLRCRHRGLVGELVGRGAVRDQAGRTAGEHLRDVAAAWPDAAPAMAAATELFEAAWYGGAVTGPAEAARFADLEGQVLGARPVRR